MSILEHRAGSFRRSYSLRRARAFARPVCAFVFLLATGGFVSTFGQTDWMEHETVQSFYGAPGTASRSVLYDEEEGIYRMWYEKGQGGGIGYATSGDGLYWKVEAPSVLGPGTTGALDDCWVGLPCVIFDPRGGIYQMWYSAARCPTSERYSRIFHATSADGIRWETWRDGGDMAAPVLVPGTPREWDGGSARAARVLLDESSGTFRMWYTGYGGIGYAVSSDGISWTKSPWNPVLEAPRGFDIEHAWVLPRGSQLEMWYGVATRDGREFSIHYATSIDSATWTLHEDVLDLAIDGPGDRDEWGAYSPSVVFDEPAGVYRMWYTSGLTTQAFSTVCAESVWDMPLVLFSWREVDGPARTEIELDAGVIQLPPGRTLRSLEWDFGDWGAAGVGEIVRHTYTGPGRYSATLTVVDDLGRELSARQSVIVGCEAGSVSPWTAVDLRPDGPFEFVPAGARIEGGVLRVCTGGRPDPGGLLREPRYSRRDRFHFVYQRTDGDARLTAQVAESTPGAIGAKVALMFRASLDPASPFAAVVLETYEGRWARPFLLYRPSANAKTAIADWGELKPTTGGMRIERRGRRFTAEVSMGDESWRPIAQVTLDLPRMAFCGVAVSGTEIEQHVATSYEPFQTALADLEIVSLPLLFRRGDVNSDGTVNLTDAMAVLAWLFRGGSDVSCQAAADVDADGGVGLTDACYLLGGLFGRGGPPALPFPSCSAGSPYDQALGCTTSGESCE